MVGLGLWTSQNWVILGSDTFESNPLSNSTNASVNFFDNNADNGGSPPGGEDNLVLGHTNFTAVLTTADIGVSTVTIDTHVRSTSRGRSTTSEREISRSGRRT